MSRLYAFAACAIALSLVDAPAAAQSKQECADAYLAGQVSRKDGKLRDAREKFETCAKAACPGWVQKDCKPWLTQLEREIPTLAITVTDASGAPLPGASVTVDGAALTASDAPVDPGDHLVHVEASGMAPADQHVKLAAGDGRREVTVRLERAAAAAPAPASARRPVPIGPIVTGAIGVVGMGVFAGLGLAGNAKKSELDRLGCKPHCDPAAVSSARSLWLGADIAVGVGAAALTTAAVLLIVHFATPARTPAAWRFSPSTGGGALSLSF